MEQADSKRYVCNAGGTITCGNTTGKWYILIAFIQHHKYLLGRDFMKKTLSVLLVICFLCTSLNLSVWANAQTYETFTVKDNDKVIIFPLDYQPIKYPGSSGFYLSLLPLKPIAEYFGCTYSYDEKTGNATVINPKYDHTVVFPPDGNRIIVNGVEIKNIMGEYYFYSKRINGKPYIRYDSISEFLYLKSCKWEDNALVIYDDPLIELDAFYNDFELIFEEGKRPYIEGFVYSGAYHAVVPVKQMLEFLGYSVNLDMDNKIMEIRSDKGTIKIEFREEYRRWRMNLLEYKDPKFYYNGKLQDRNTSYDLFTFQLFNRGGTLYTSISNLSNLLNDFMGQKYYTAYWSVTRGQIFWSDADYNRIKENAKNPSFADVKSTDWYYNSVIRMVKDGLISGYSDNTFRPMENMTVSEFIKMLVVALGYHDLHPVKGDYWAKNYINKALETGLIQNGEFDNYDRPITRGEMARLIIRAEKDETAFNNWESYVSSITDDTVLTPEERETAAKIIASGIMTGFSDGSFGFRKNATRAQACTIMLKFLNKGERTPPK